jgi:antitoxin PrlF
MKLSSKGQITIPKAIRDELGLEPGEEVEFEETEQGFVLKRKDDSFREQDIQADDSLADDTEDALDMTRGSLD